MTEQLVTLDTAKLAKEKNYEDNSLESLYGKNQQGEFVIFYDYEGYFYNKENYLAPPQSLLQKWLREVHNIDVWAQPFVSENLQLYLPDESYSYFVFKDGIFIKDEIDLLDFEEALEKGLQEALKLVKL